MSTRASPPDGIVLMGHGSRDVAGAREFLALSDAVRTQPEVAGIPVEPGFLEFAGGRLPSIQGAFDRCVARGARRIAAVPAVLFAGSHGTEDMPRQVSLARRRYPDVQVRLADLIGIDDGLLDLLVERADTATITLPRLPADQTCLLLVTSGSARREANADVFKAARLLADRAAGRLVEVAFLRLARPFLQDAARRCERLGARRVVVLPLLVNTGLLARRVPRKLVWLRRQIPSVEFVEAPYLGIDPGLASLLARRACEAFEKDRAGTVYTPVRLAPGQERCRPRWAGHTPQPSTAGARGHFDTHRPQDAREPEGVPA
jgi:sirohydrochlorin cobaltochelatase